MHHMSEAVTQLRDGAANPQRPNPLGPDRARPAANVGTHRSAAADHDALALSPNDLPLRRNLVDQVF
jgi:hypothetical protein